MDVHTQLIISWGGMEFVRWSVCTITQEVRKVVCSLEVKQQIWENSFGTEFYRNVRGCPMVQAHCLKSWWLHDDLETKIYLPKRIDSSFQEIFTSFKEREMMFHYGDNCVAVDLNQWELGPFPLGFRSVHVKNPPKKSGSVSVYFVKLNPT